MPVPRPELWYSLGVPSPMEVISHAEMSVMEESTTKTDFVTSMVADLTCTGKSKECDDAKPNNCRRMNDSWTEYDHRIDRRCPFI
jgi:hypothetical protein